MKKALFLVTILMLSVFTTACINNFAVQELNNKAAQFMKDGDYKSAISRLQSSVDLDPTIFESQYNLGVAYTEDEDYDEAIEAFKAALELKPESKEVYYSMAVMYENYAKDLFAGNTKAQKEQVETEDEDSDDTAAKNNQTTDGKYKPTETEIENVKKYYGEAIADYEKYMELAPDASDSSDVTAHIEEIRAMLETIDKDTN